MPPNDPCLDRLQSYLTRFFPDLKSMDRGQAIFWFALHYHKGPGSNLYAAVQSFAFSGVPLLAAPARGDQAWAPYQMLSVTYQPFARPQAINRPDKAEKQHRSREAARKARSANKRKAKALSFNPRHLPVPMYLDPQFQFGWWTQGFVQGSDLP